MLSENKPVPIESFQSAQCKFSSGLASPPTDYSEHKFEFKLHHQEGHNNFEKLVNEIKQILGPCSGIDSDGIDVEKLKDVMREYESQEEEWRKYALVDPKKNYTRNGVDDINHKANLMILVWNPQKASAIHDHANAHCIVRVLKGTLRETLYDWPDADDKDHTMKEKRSLDYGAGGVTYMSDQLGLHRMYNPDPKEVAVSLHLYTPPYASQFGCRVFNEKTGHAQRVDTPLYSDGGVKVERV